jgi:hypothetical protein
VLRDARADELEAALWSTLAATLLDPTVLTAGLDAA